MYRLDSHIHCQYSPDSSTKIDDIIKKSIVDCYKTEHNLWGPMHIIKIEIFACQKGIFHV